LIYKRGQAGVTKASVTIVFDNHDKKNSPIGFEEYAQISVTRQIVLGGTSKYLINGHRAQQQAVQNLFQSVQLNINNPNFLIMQGRITKVLNMKAVEILAMIEEAAGTRMFEDRRDKALKTMTKKDMKVQEINELLKDEIEPKLDKLRMEKRAFLEFQQTQSDLERLTRLVVAHDYLRNKEKAKQSAADLAAKKQRALDLQTSAVRIKNEIATLEEDVKRVQAIRDKELRKGGKFQALEEEVKTHSHEGVRLATVIDLKLKGLADGQNAISAAERSVKDLQSQLTEKKKVYEKLQKQYESAKNDLTKQETELEEKQELLQTLQTGIGSKDGQESGYQGQLQEARARVSAATTEQEQAKVKIAHLEKTIKEEEPKAKKAKEQNSTMIKDLDLLKTQATKLELELKKLGFEEGAEKRMADQENELQKKIRQLRGEVEVLKRKVANVDFSYSDPSPNFDRSKVKGLVAQLLTLDESKSRAGTALEICAGGRLYNVVVDTEVTGSQLLQNGKLRKRVTIIPLNKISAFRAAAEKIGAAQNLAPGKVALALDLIGYDKDIARAMEYVFGSTLICEDAETAKRVTFDPAVRMKSVTVEGDVYDPSGTLSGGSAPNSSGVLLTLQKLNALNKELKENELALQQLRERVALEKKKTEQMREIKQAYELKLHEIELTEEQINSNSSSSVRTTNNLIEPILTFVQIIQAVAEMKETVAKLRQDIVDSKARQAESQKDAKRIERDMADFSRNKDGKLAELQKAVDTLKRAVAKNNAPVKELQKDFKSAQFDSEQAGADLTAAEESQQEAEAALKAQQNEISELRAEQKRVQEAHDTAKAFLSDERAKLTGFDDELRSLEQTLKAKAARTTEESLEQQKLAHQIEKFHKEQQVAAQSVTAMEAEHEWIIDEVDSFGKPGTAYDFKGQNMAECKSSLRNLTERFQGMKKKVNPKVMNMMDSVEKKEVALKTMIRTIVKDKKKIEETISSLDEYKKTALEKTWSKVNGDFGNIFGELLPGSFAKLEAPEGKTIMDGLEVKVCLGKVWKQSLTELSGGQRYDNLFCLSSKTKN
jgi:structural maintenance of chromosome 2